MISAIQTEFPASVDAVRLEILRRRGVGDVVDGERVAADSGGQRVAVKLESTAVRRKIEHTAGCKERKACMDEPGPISVDVEDIFGALGIGKRGRIKKDQVEAAGIAALGLASLEIQKFHDIHARDGAHTAVAKAVQMHIFDGPVKIGVGQVDGLYVVGTAFEGGDTEGARVGKKIEDAFVFGSLGQHVTQGAMVKKQPRIEKIREVDAEFEIALGDDARDGSASRMYFFVLLAAFLTTAKFAQDVIGGEFQDTRHLLRHGVKPQVLFDGVFFVRTLKEGIDSVCFAGTYAFRKGVEIDAQGDFRDVAVIDAVGTDMETFCPFFKMLGAFGEAVGKHGGLGSPFFGWGHGCFGVKLSKDMRQDQARLRRSNADADSSTYQGLWRTESGVGRGALVMSTHADGENEAIYGNLRNNVVDIARCWKQRFSGDEDARGNATRKDRT